MSTERHSGSFTTVFQNTKQIKAAISVEIDSYQPSHDVGSNFSVMVQRDTHVCSSKSFQLNKGEQSENDGPLVTFKSQTTLHFKKFSNLEFQRKTVQIKVISQPSGAVLEHAELELNKYVSALDIEGQSSFSLKLSQDGIARITVHWQQIFKEFVQARPQKKSKSFLNNTHARSQLNLISEISEERLDCPEDGEHQGDGLNDQAQFHPRSKTLDDNYTYANLICNDTSELAHTQQESTTQEKQTTTQDGGTRSDSMASEAKCGCSEEIKLQMEAL